MNIQPQQRFCVNCGQPLTPGAAFCAACGTQMGTLLAGPQGQFPAGAQQVYHQPYMQAPMQAQDDPLHIGLASGYIASGMERPSQLRVRRPRSRLRAYGCLLLFLVVLVGPLLGFALTKGLPHQIFTYVVVAMVVIFLILVLIAMLATRRGREALSEGCMEGCLDAILGGFLGGG
jgi:zinc-ribbon domain